MTGPDPRRLAAWAHGFAFGTLWMLWLATESSPLVVIPCIALALTAVFVVAKEEAKP